MPTGDLISYDMYRALATVRAGADCAGKAARLNRATKRGVHAISVVKMCDEVLRMAYTDVDSSRRVVVWSIVVSASVANWVAVGVGTQSPIFLLEAAPCLVGGIRAG